MTCNPTNLPARKNPAAFQRQGQGETSKRKIQSGSLGAVSAAVSINFDLLSIATTLTQTELTNP
jgi:hypothetical protein